MGTAVLKTATEKEEKSHSIFIQSLP